MAGCATWGDASPPTTPSQTESESAGAGWATGVVFDDRNADGVRDPGEPGLPGVAVSNGREVVPSDAGGRYRLPLGERGVLFVIKPRDWMTPVDSDGLPRFYRIHDPAGSPPGLAFSGIEPRWRRPRRPACS